MSTVYGLTPAGFVVKPLEVIKAEIEADLKVTFGQSIDLAPQSNWGQFVGIMSERFALLWSLAEAVYTALTPDGASGVPQDNVCSLTGTARAAPTFSRVTGTCCGTTGTVLPAGRLASVTTAGTRFATVAAATIAAVLVYEDHKFDGLARGAVVSHDGKIWLNVSPVGVTVTGEDYLYGEVGDTVGPVDGDNAVWLCIGEGDGSVAVEFKAVEAGPLGANAGTLRGIETPVAGWSTVYNLEDAFVLGAALEDDTTLRMRREAELRAQGLAAAPAVRAKVGNVGGVLGCYVFANNTDTIDADGLLPHSIEVVVDATDLPDVDAAIRAALFAAVGGGINTNGTVTGTVVDAQGVPWTIRFSRVEKVPVYATVEASIDPETWPEDGADQVAGALLTYGARAYTNGANVIAAALNARPFAVSGVVDSVTKIGLAPGPTTTATLPISLRQIAVLDTTRITVVPTPRTTS